MPRDTEYQVVSVPLAGGQNEESSPIAVDPPSVILARDAEFTRGGSIRKRRGASLLGAWPSSKYKVAAVLVHRESAHYSTSRGAHNLHDTASGIQVGTEQCPGPLPCEVTERPAERMGDVRDPTLGAMESPTGSRTVMHAWQEATSGLIWYRVCDATTGSVIIDPTPVAAGSEPRISPCPTAGTYVLAWRHTTASTIKATRVSATSGVMTGGVVTLTSSVVANSGWDIATDPGDKVHLGYWATDTLTLVEFTAALAATGRTYTNAPVSTNYGPVSVALESTTHVWIAGYHTTAGAPTTRMLIARVALSGYTATGFTDNDYTATPSLNTRISLCFASDTSHMWFAGSAIVASSVVDATAGGGRDGAGMLRIWDLGGSASTTMPAAYADAPGHLLAAQGFYGGTGFVDPWWPTVYYFRGASTCRSLEAYGSILHVASVSVENSQGAVVATQCVLPVGRWGTDSANLPPALSFSGSNGDPVLTTHCAHSYEVLSGVWGFDSMVLSRISPQASTSLGQDFVAFGTTGTLALGADEVRVRHTPNPLPTEQATPHVMPICSGGIASCHDGLQLHEATLQAAPSRPTISSLGGAASGPLDDKSRWRACWKWVDAQGHVRRSAPSEPSLQFDLTGSGNTTAIMQVLLPPPSAIVGANRFFLSLELYRQDDSVDAIYRLAKTEPIDIESHSDLAWVHVTDDVSAALMNEVLYTEGGDLPNAPLPAALGVATAGQRIWVLDGEDQTRLWPSKLPSQDGEQEAQSLGPSWAAELAIRAPEPILALAAMDDRLVAFGERGVYLVEGEGPNNNGDGSTFSVRGVSSGFGVQDPRSVVATPVGVVFRGPRGVYLLGRDLSVKYIGQGVEMTISGQVITNAFAVPDRSEVRLCIGANSSGSLKTARMLVWDYFGDAWAYWTTGAGPACIRNGRVERVCEAATVANVAVPGTAGVYRESDTVFADAVSVWDLSLAGGYLFRVDTPHIRPQGRDAGHMEARLAQFVTDTPPDVNSFGVVLSWVKDYGATLASGSGSQSYTGAEISGQRFLEVTPAGSSVPGLKCAAIQFSIEERVDQTTLEIGTSHVPPAVQTAPPSVARLSLELAVLPGLLRGLPATSRK